jgi:NAD(P)-dependent dehydrogenase (short-subunit alcohol dehydrogenase family)
MEGTDMRFKGKAAIVTGGGKGIGRAISVAFGVEGARVLIGYGSDDRAADETAEYIRQSGAEADICRVDVRKRDECDAFVDRAVDLFGKIDICVNNAGVSTMNWAVDLTEEEWNYNMDVNAKGVFLCCQKQVKQFLAQGSSGRIINVASIAAKRPAMLLAHYAASKYAVLGFSKTLAREVSEYGITVNCVCPGFVRTAMQEREVGWEAKLHGLSREQVLEGYVAATPLGRLEEPEDVAGVVLFLASDEAAFMTGQAINVAGGTEMAL